MKTTELRELGFEIRKEEENGSVFYFQSPKNMMDLITEVFDPMNGFSDLNLSVYPVNSADELDDESVRFLVYCINNIKKRFYNDEEE